MSEQAPLIRIERVGGLWRIYSLDDMGGEFIDCDREAMGQLLDLLLRRASEFGGEVEASPYATMPPLVEPEDETPEDWQPRKGE